MKKILGVVAVLFIVLASSLTGCTTSGSTTAQDVPQYTADQVIYIVQAKYPVCYKRENNQTLQSPTSVTATYMGNKVWKVSVTCPLGYRLVSYNSLITWLTRYFYEADGSLWYGYNADTKTLSSPDN